MISAIFTAMTAIGQSFLTFFTGLLTSVVAIFYTAPSGSGNGEITDIGYLVLAGVVVSFVFFVIRWITRLIKLRG